MQLQPGVREAVRNVSGGQRGLDGLRQVSWLWDSRIAFKSYVSRVPPEGEQSGEPQQEPREGFLRSMSHSRDTGIPRNQSAKRRKCARCAGLASGMARLTAIAGAAWQRTLPLRHFLFTGSGPYSFSPSSPSVQPVTIRKINWITIIGSAVTITAVSPINPADSRKLSSPWKLMSCNLFSISMTRNLPNEEIRKKTAQNW